MDDSRSEAWDRVHFLGLTIILGFLTIFKKCQASSTFEALNYVSLLTCQRMWGRLFRSGGDLGISVGSIQAFRHPFILWYERWACIKDSAGKSGLLWIQGISLSISLEAKNTGPSKIQILEGKLLVRCFWKVGLLLQSKIGHQLSSPDDMWCMELSSSCLTEI